MYKEIRINMLGRFSFEYDGKAIIEDTGKIHKVWTMLGYMLANKDSNYSGDELMDILSGHDDSVDPAKVVKNMAYRVRKLLSGSGLPEQEYVVQSKGTYHWNKEVAFTCDVDDFVKHCQLAGSAGDSGEAISHLQAAIDLYQGDFLPSTKYDSWAVRLQVYYHRMFTECIKKLYQLLDEQGDYQFMLPICEKALKIDNFDEDIYCMYIESLIKCDMHKEALTAYTQITTLLYDEMGVSPSEKLKSLYSRIIQTLKSVETDLDIIKGDLIELEKAEASYFCQYQTFRDIYRFLARRIIRTGESIHVMLCTLTDKQGDVPDTQHLGQAMDTLKETIGSCLRKGDAFARYSPSQFVILLPDTIYENCDIVAKRINAAYRKTRISRRMQLSCKSTPVDPKLS